MLVAMEGIDASGKRTQSGLLTGLAEAEGLTVGTMAFPRYERGRFGPVLARYLNGAFGELSSVPWELPAQLFALDRFEAKAELEAMLARCDLVLLDRYVASNLAYQSARAPASERAAAQDWIEDMEHGLFLLPRTDLTVYLDVPVQTAGELLHAGRERSYTDDAEDLHEKDRGYTAAVREVYLDLADRSVGGSWHVEACCDSDGDGGGGALRPAEDIAASLWRVIHGSMVGAGGS